MFKIVIVKVDFEKRKESLPNTYILKNHGIRYCVTIVTSINL